MVKKKVLVLGSKGQLGNEIQLLASQYMYDFLFYDVDTLDICNYEQLQQFFSNHTLFAVINCAAYTAVDKAELEVDSAYKINAEAVKSLSILTKEYDVYLIHISTDYVFDGKNYYPYLETDKVNPQSAYGRSKLEGERAVLEFAANAIIIRTAWLYSSFGNNFVKTIKKYAIERGTLQVVSDQIGTPTYAKDLAKGILESLAYPQQGVEFFHFTNEGVCSWYDFAKAIVELSDISCTITPIGTKDYRTAAQRPAFSVLSKTKFKTTFHCEIPYWRDSLKECLCILNH